MFQFPAFASYTLCIQVQIPSLTLGNSNRSANRSLPSGSRFPRVEGGLPHSEIVGSKPIRSSPTLIAAYHVLHRLCMPRHPPNALTTLDRSHCQCPSAPHGSEWHRRLDQLLETSNGRMRSAYAPWCRTPSKGNDGFRNQKATGRTMSSLHVFQNTRIRRRAISSSFKQVTHRSDDARRAHALGERVRSDDAGNGGAGRDRTDDLKLAKLPLSQLSYGPRLVGPGRFELPTSPLSGVRSNQLSYGPEP